MVFESLLVDVLNRVLGDYVVNVDQTQLKIGIWNGDVVLYDLDLKETALDDLQLPIKTVCGRICKLTLKIPWHNIYVAPVEVSVQGLYLMVLSQEANYDVTKEEAFKLDYKRKQLLKYEAKRLNPQKGNTDDTFIEKLVAQIVKNVQIKVDNIHVRYEDKYSNPGHPFSIGITLKSLHVLTTDQSWQEFKNEPNLKKIYKLLILNSLSVYFNCDSELLCSLDVLEFIEHFQCGIIDENYNYILGPINLTAKLELNLRPENDSEPFSTPKIKLKFDLEKLLVSLEKRQYENFLILNVEFNRISKGLIYRKYRPLLHSYKGFYKQWWQFAITCILKEQVQKKLQSWNWESLLQHRNTCRQYEGAYYDSRLQLLKQKYVSENVTDQLQLCETSLDLFNLILIREKVNLEVDKLEKKQQSESKGWFSSWFSTASKATQSNDLNLLQRFEEEMTDEEKSKLFEAIDYDELSSPVIYPNTYIASIFDFHLGSLEIYIKDQDIISLEVLKIDLNFVRCTLSQRPTDCAFKFSMDITDFEIYGTKQDGVVPKLLSTQGIEKTEKRLLSVIYETNPLDSKYTQDSTRIFIRGQPLEIVYDAKTINHLYDIFKPPLSSIQAIALSDFKKFSHNQIQFAIEQSGRIELDIIFEGSYFVLPYEGFRNPSATHSEMSLIINFGQLRVSTISNPSLILERLRLEYPENEYDDENDVMLKAYDHFQILLENFQVLIAYETENWTNYMNKDEKSKMHLLLPSSLSILCEKCSLNTISMLPSIKLSAKLPSFAIDINDNRLLKLILLFDSIPKPNYLDIEEPVDESDTSFVRNSLSMVSIGDYFESFLVDKTDIKYDENEFEQMTNLVTKFVMDEFKVTIYRSDEHRSAILKFALKTVVLKSNHKTYNTSIQLKVNGIEMVQFRQNDEHLVWIQTPIASDDCLLKFNYKLVDKRSRDFLTKYGLCTQHVNVELNKITFTFHSEATQELYMLVKSFLRDLEAFKLRTSSRSLSSSQSKSHTSLTDDTFERKAVRPYRIKRAEIDNTMLLRVNILLSHVEVQIRSDTCYLTCLRVSGMDSVTIFKKTCIEFQAKLDNFSLLDPNPNSLYKEIISVGSDKALNLNVKQYLYEDGHAIKLNEVHYDIKIEVGCIRLVYLNLFVSNVLDYTNHLSDVIVTMSSVAAETAKQNLQLAFENALKVHFVIDLSAPNIIVPLNSIDSKAIVFNLSRLFLKDEFTNQENNLAQILDCFTLHLSDMQLIYAQVKSPSEMTTLMEITRPTSFSLRLIRKLIDYGDNLPDFQLSAELQTIAIVLKPETFTVFGRLFNENFKETSLTMQPDSNDMKLSMDFVDRDYGYNAEFGAIIEETVEATVEEPAKITIHEPKQGNVPKPRTRCDSGVINISKKPVTCLLNFFFTFDGFNVTIIESTNSQPYRELAQFTLKDFTIRGDVFSRDSMSIEVTLDNCFLDDLRPDRSCKITRMIEKRFYCSRYPSNRAGERCMVAVKYTVKQMETIVQANIYSFTIIFVDNYIRRIIQFFSEGFKKMNDPVEFRKISAAAATRSKTTSKSKFTFTLKIEEPDIVILRDVNSPQLDAVIFNCEGCFTINMVDDLLMSADCEFHDIQSYVCNYVTEKRQETKCDIISRFSLSMNGTFSESTNEFLSEIVTSNIVMCLNPWTVELMFKAYTSFYNAFDFSTPPSACTTSIPDDIWNESAFQDNDFWFLTTEMGIDALSESLGSLSYSFQSNRNIAEYCHVTVPKILITLEMGTGNSRITLLTFESNLTAAIRNWSSNLRIVSYVHFQMAYYNKNAGAWEPIVEPIECIENFEPTPKLWNLRFEYVVDLNSCLRRSNNDFEMDAPKSIIRISAVNNLEITISKTCYEVLCSLNKAFVCAYEHGVGKDLGNVQHTIKIAPYKVINETGYRIDIITSKEASSFIHIGPFNNRRYPDREISLEHDDFLDLHLKEQLTSTAATSIDYSSDNVKVIKQPVLCFSIVEFKKSLEVPIVKAGKQYYTVYKGPDFTAAIIVVVKVIDYTFEITIRSVLQITNLLSKPVNCYSLNLVDDNSQYVTSIESGRTKNFSMNVIYRSTGLFRFSFGPNMSKSNPFDFNRLKKSGNLFDICKCRFKNNNDCLINAVGESETVNIENPESPRENLSQIGYCYNIYLMAPLCFQNLLPCPVEISSPNFEEVYRVDKGKFVEILFVELGVTVIRVKYKPTVDETWAMETVIAEEYKDFDIWTFVKLDSRIGQNKINLGIHCKKIRKTLHVSLFCPYWVSNKTNTHLYLKACGGEDELVYLNPSTSPKLFSPFDTTNFFAKKKVIMSSNGVNWSEKFPIDTVGSSGVFQVFDETNMLQVCVNIHINENKLTKQIILSPYYILSNNTEFVIYCQEADRPADWWLPIYSMECIPFWPHNPRKGKCLRIRIGLYDDISIQFYYTESGSTLLKLNNQHRGVFVDIDVSETATFIKFYLYTDGMAPALLVNHTDLLMKYWEKSDTNVMYLRPKHSALFTWDNYSGSKILVWSPESSENENKFVENNLKNDNAGELIYESRSIYWISFLNGPQRTLLFTRDMNILRELQISSDIENIHTEIVIELCGLGISLCDNIDQKDILYAAITNSGVIWETTKSPDNPFKPLSKRESSLIEDYYQQYLAYIESEKLDPQSKPPADRNHVFKDQNERYVLDFESGLMHKPKQRFIRRTFNNGLWVHMKMSPSLLELRLKVNQLQIDNQMQNRVFPIVLAPVPPSKSVSMNSNEIKPFIDLYVVKRNMGNSSVDQYKYFKVLIQEFHVKFDMAFLNAVLDIFTFGKSPYDDSEPLFEMNYKRASQNLMEYLQIHSIIQKQSFYDLLHFSPLKIHISFSLSGGSASDLPYFLDRLIQGLGVALTDINDVVFRLGYFERKLVFLNQNQLLSEIKRHYVTQLITQFYVLVLGLDIIGNPYGVVIGLKKGVEDLFYEPYSGFMQGPEEFAEGLFLGVRSLVGHTVGGAAGAASRFTGAVGRGLAALTFDDEYQQQRRQINQRPGNIQEEMVRSGKGFVVSIFDGISGVVTKPISGARKDGVEGFFKGLGKGTAGLIARPAGGVVDFASGSFDVLKRFAHREGLLCNLRPGRVFEQDGTMKPYSRFCTTGMILLQEVNKCHYENNEVYWFHMFTSSFDEVVILSNKRIMHMVQSSILGEWKVMWVFPWKEINRDVKVQDNAVQLSLVHNRTGFCQLFGSSGRVTKLIHVRNQQKRILLIRKINECLQKYT